MRAWIDATQPGASQRVFGLSLLERQLRTLRQTEWQLHRIDAIDRNLGDMKYAATHLRQIVEERMLPSQIWVELPSDAPIPEDLPSDLVEVLPIRWMRTPGSVRDRLQRALVDADGETLLALSGNTVVDRRVIEHLAWWSEGNAAFISDAQSMSGAVVRLDTPLPDTCGEDKDLLAIALSLVANEDAKRLSDRVMNSYIAKLRRDVAPYVYLVEGESSLEAVERFLFSSNYKGSTDFLTKWIYPPLVWAMVKPLANHRVHPNWPTCVGIAACLAAIPFFAAGMWVPGLILAYLMSVLDSVDGKLARLTFQSSAQGDVLDHGTDIVHPPFWYMAWAWGLSGGNPYSGLFIASLWMTGFYIVDRIMEMLFKSCTGRSIHDYTPLDAKLRTVIARRNVFLAVLTLALPFGFGAEVFYGMVAWQGLTLAFHLSRVIRFWDEREKQSVPTGNEKRARKHRKRANGADPAAAATTASVPGGFAGPSDADGVPGEAHFAEDPIEHALAQVKSG